MEEKYLYLAVGISLGMAILFLVQIIVINI